MKVRLYPAVGSIGQIDVSAWNGLAAAGCPVGRCHCNTALTGTRIGDGDEWATVRCPRHGETVCRVGQLAAV